MPRSRPKGPTYWQNGPLPLRNKIKGIIYPSDLKRPRGIVYQNGLGVLNVF